MFYFATHGMLPSNYILNGVPEKFDHLPHSYYVLPSSALATPARQRLNDRRLRQGLRAGGKIPVRLTTRIGLPVASPLNIYRVTKDNLIAILRRILEQPPDAGDVFFGSAGTGLGTWENPDKYITTQRAVVAQ